MAGTNRMLEGLKRNGESRGVVMNFLATQGLKKTMCNKERKRVVSLKVYFFFVEVVFFFVEVVFLVEVVFFVVVLFVTVGAGL